MQRALGVAVLMMGALAHRSVAMARSADSADGTPVGVDVALVVLHECVTDPPRVLDDFGTDELKRWACAQAARAVVKDGTDADYEELWSVFDALPDESPLTVDVLDAFLDHRVEDALAALGGASRPVPIEPVADDREMPEFLRDGPANLKEAWRLYQSVVATQEKAFEAPAPATAIRFHWRTFRGVVAAFLRGRVPPETAVAELSRYQWGGGCGNGSEVLFVTRAKALLIAHVELGRIDLALAASGALDGPFRGMEGRASSDPRLLAAAGIDWERYDLGGVLSGRVDLAVPLALRGSDRTARSLLEAVRALHGGGEGVPRDVSESLLFPKVGVDPTTTASVDPTYSPDDEPEERAASPTNQPL